MRGIPTIALALITTIADGINGPYGMAFGPDGSLYVAEAEAGRVIIIDPETGRADILRGVVQ